MSLSTAPARADRRLAPSSAPASKSNFTPRKPVVGGNPPEPSSTMGKTDPSAVVLPQKRDAAPPAKGGGAAKPEPDILFQTYFKSVGPRTYAAQVKRAGNGNHFVVLTEGKRDDKTGEVRKTRLFIFSEDFSAFFKMLQETAVFVRDNPVPADVKKKRERFWAKNGTSIK